MFAFDESGAQDLQGGEVIAGMRAFTPGLGAPPKPFQRLVRTTKENSADMLELQFWRKTVNNSRYRFDRVYFLLVRVDDFIAYRIRDEVSQKQYYQLYREAQTIVPTAARCLTPFEILARELGFDLGVGSARELLAQFVKRGMERNLWMHCYSMSLDDQNLVTYYDGYATPPSLRIPIENV